MGGVSSQKQSPVQQFQTVEPSNGQQLVASKDKILHVQSTPGTQNGRNNQFDQQRAYAMMNEQVKSQGDKSQNTLASTNLHQTFSQRNQINPNKESDQKRFQSREISKPK